METRYSPDSYYTGLPQNLQPVNRFFIPSGRSAPGTCLQACCGIHRCLGYRLGCHVQWACSLVWTGPQLHWHINCLEFLAVRLALSHLGGRLLGKDVLVRMDNTVTIANINRHGGFCSHCMSQLAHHLLLWSQKHLRSLRAIYIQGMFN